MAIGTTAAVLAATAVSAGSSYLGNRSQNRALDNANQTARDTTDAQVNLYRDIYNQNRQDLEPFRQFELQRTNALGEIFGLDPVGMPSGTQQTNAFLQGQQFTDQRQGPDYLQYVSDNPDLGREYGRIRNEGFGSSLPGSYDNNGDGRLQADEYGRFHYERFGRGEGRELPGLNGNAFLQVPNNPGTPNVGGPNPGGQVNPGGPPSVGGPDPGEQGSLGSSVTPVINSNVAGADRFNNSLFAAAFNENFNRDRTAIDDNLGAQGLVYSGARLNAVEDSRARNFQNSLSQYINTLMGAPSSGPAINAGINSANQFASQAGNAFGNQGNFLANSALQRGNNNANMFNNIGSAFNFGLGGIS
jgi:hypothetical protein